MEHLQCFFLGCPNVAGDFLFLQFYGFFGVSFDQVAGYHVSDSFEEEFVCVDFADDFDIS